MSLHYRCALITGASAGLGEEFARQLANCCDHLVLVARRVARLDQLAAELREHYPSTAVTVLSADLALERDRIELVTALDNAGISIDLLINNAGLGDYGDFLSAEWGNVKSMLDVNMTALTHLTHLIAPKMVKRGYGAVLNVSSLASTLPIPDFAVYAATKAYVSSFTEALRIEMQDEGVDVMSLCPGPVKTEFGSVARREGAGNEIPGARSYFYVSKEQVVSEAITGLEKRRARVFPGLQVAAAGLIIGALPLLAIRLLMSRRPRR